MVLLTYQTEDEDRERILVDKESPLKSGCPKTAYIDKLSAFSEVYADEERCDLFFICNDGEIPAHRLVISNASKYIMGMQDELPPWYPVYISVPDLSIDIVKTLVRLAYTGQMSIPPGTSSDELLDAMQALGWVNTDCLTATFLDTSGANTEDEGGEMVTTTSTENLEAVLKKNFPASVKGDDTSDDEGMEMNVPDVPLSDDEGRLEIVTEPNSPKGKKGAAAKPKAKQAKKPKVTPPKSTPLNSRRRQSPKPEPKTPETSPTVARRNPRKNADDTNKTTNNATPVKPEPKKKVEEEQPEPVADAEPAEPLRSRTRTIKKPKKFEDSIVLTPSKRKESPTKSPSKPAPKPKQNDVKETPEPAKNSKKPAANSKTAKSETKAVTPAAKNRRSTSTEIKNSLITSYFNKRSPRASNDAGSTEDVSEQNNTSEADEPRKPENKEEKGVTATENGNGSPSASLRTRGKSNASSKGEVDTEQEESAPAIKSRRKRSNQDGNEDAAEEPDANPQKRGRKASTVSNASKSSNKDTAAACNDVEEKEENGEGPRTRRSRQE